MQGSRLDLQAGQRGMPRCATRCEGISPWMAPCLDALWVPSGFSMDSPRLASHSWWRVVHRFGPRDPSS